MFGATPVSRILANPGMRQAIERTLAAKGTHGDRLIAHLSPREAAMLKARGGAGTRNPRTGLLQFYDPDAGHADRTGAAGTQDTAGNIGEGGRGRMGDGGLGGERGGDGGGVMGGASGAYNSKSGLMAKSPITVEALSRQDDYNDVGNTGLENIGGAIAGLLGFNEIDPTLSNRKALAAGKLPGMQADWGYDPAGAIGGALGLGIGIPGLGIISDLISRRIGRPLEANLGPNVFGSGGLLSGSSGGAGSPGTSGPGGGGRSPGSAIAGVGGFGRAGDGLMGSPASPAVRPTTPAGTPAPSLTPLMSRTATTDVTGDRFGALPSWGTTPYPIGQVPSSYPVPSLDTSVGAPGSGALFGSGPTGGTGRQPFTPQQRWQAELRARYGGLLGL